jgi:hypothetical protein
MLSLQQNQRTGSAQKGVREWAEMAQTMYTHASKCKNDKIKERKINKLHVESAKKRNYFLKH